MVKDKYFGLFMEFSEFTTGFSKVKLYGTGLAKDYYNTVSHTVGYEFHKMLDVFNDINAKNNDKELFYNELFFSPEFRSLVKNIINLWFTGLWVDKEGSFIVLSGESYLNGLMWNVIGAHVLGGKPYGYGSWTDKPVLKIGG
jgi:hypothetical protein